MKLTKESHPEFYEFLQDSDKNHWDVFPRRGSNFYVNYLVDTSDIDEKHKDKYVLEGIWMSDRLIDDYEYGTSEEPSYYKQVKAVPITTITYKPVDDD